MMGASEGSTKCISGEAGNRTSDPWFTRHSAYPLYTRRLQCLGYQRRNYCLWLCSLAVPVLAEWVYMALWFYVQEHPKTQLAGVLVLKHFRRLGNGLKSHPIDWEKLVYKT